MKVGADQQYTARCLRLALSMRQRLRRISLLADLLLYLALFDDLLDRPGLSLLKFELWGFAFAALGWNLRLSLIHI